MAVFPVQLTPFEVPTVVALQVPTSGRREDGMRPTPTININDLPRETVVQLCEEFATTMLARYNAHARDQVNASAGHRQSVQRLFDGAQDVGSRAK